MRLYIYIYISELQAQVFLIFADLEIEVFDHELNSVRLDRVSSARFISFVKVVALIKSRLQLFNFVFFLAAVKLYGVIYKKHAFLFYIYMDK